MAGQTLLLIFACALIVGCTSAHTDIFGALAPYIGDSVSIQSPQGNWYWTRVTGPKDKWGDFNRIEPSSSTITPDSIFEVKQVGSSNKVTLWQKSNGKFLSVINRGCPDNCANFVEPAKQVADEYCEFEVIPNGSDLSKVSFRAKDGQFLQFVNNGKTNFIMAAHMSLSSKWSEFWPKPGSLTPWSVKDVYFDIANAKTTDTKGIVAGTQTLVNNGGEKQTMTFSFKRSESVTTSSSYEGGFSLGWETTFEAGVPFLEKGHVGFSGSTEHKWTEGKSNTTGQEVQHTVPLVVGAHKKGTATFVMTQSKADIPYIVTYVNFGLQGATKTSTGTYHIEQYFNVDATYDETPIDVNEPLIV